MAFTLVDYLMEKQKEENPEDIEKIEDNEEPEDEDESMEDESDMTGDDVINLFLDYKSNKTKIHDLAIKLQKVRDEYIGIRVFDNIMLSPDKKEYIGIYFDNGKKAQRRLAIMGELSKKVVEMVDDKDSFNIMGITSITRTVIQCLFPEVDTSYIINIKARKVKVQETEDESRYTFSTFWTVGGKSNNTGFEVMIDPPAGVHVIHRPMLKDASNKE